MRLRLALLVYFFFSFNALAFNINELESLAKKSKVDSIEQLLPLFPEELRRNYILQHTSSGLQEASFEFPRVMLFQPDGQFIVTFNGHESQRSFDKLEVLQFNQTDKNFELFEAKFNNKNLVIEKNPRQCMTCHSSSSGLVHPIFQDYPNWPGFFGSKHDTPSSSPQELSALEKFNAKISDHPRYKNLLLHPSQMGKSEAPFYRPTQFDYESMPNIRFMDLLHWQNSVRITNILRQHPQYNRLLPMIVYFVNCFFNSNREELSYNDPLVQRVFSENEFKAFIEKVYSYSKNGAKPQTNQLSINKAQFYKIFDLSIGDISMEIREGKKFGFNLGLHRRDPDFINGLVIKDFEATYPNFQATFINLRLIEIVEPLIKTPLEIAFANHLDSYNRIGGMLSYSEYELIRLIKEAI